MMKIHRKWKIINVFINKNIVKIFGALAGTLVFGAYGTGTVVRSIHVKLIFFNLKKPDLRMTPMGTFCLERGA